MTSPESALLKQMNKLKEVASEDLLTEEQHGAINQIRQHREQDVRFINLYGSKDAGKTFLCWVLQRSEGWKYYPNMPEKADEPVVIYDHSDPDRMATRRLRNHANINGLATVVYVTETPAEELHPRVELSPSDSHYERIQSNWESMELPVENTSISQQ